MIAWLRRMFAEQAPMRRYREVAERHLMALSKARQKLPHDPVLEREYRNVERQVKEAQR